MDIPVREPTSRPDDVADIRPLRISVFGRLELRRGDELLPRLGSARAESLLVYLLLRADQTRARQRIAGELWPESTESQARTNLRNVLHLLRHALPGVEHYLEVDARVLGWRSRDSSVDAWEMRAAVARAREAERASAARIAALRDAAACYRGDLLEDCIDEWLTTPRDRYRDLYFQVLRDLVGALVERGEHVDAIRLGRELVHRDPLNEDHHRLLLDAHHRAGDRAGALRAYHEYATVIEHELGVEPSPDMRRRYAEVAGAGAMDGTRVGARAAVQSVAATAARLVGRDDEWTALRRCWQAAMDGRGQLVLVTGEPGIGKTRLAEELGRLCTQGGHAVAQARSFPDAGDLGYGVVVSWLRGTRTDSWVRTAPTRDRMALARLLPELDVPEEHWWRADFDRLQLFEAAVGALTHTDRPLLLVADDAQWMDAPSVELIHYLLRSPQARHVLLVATVRLEELGTRHPLTDVVDALRADDRVTEVPLGRFGRAHTAELARLTLGAALDAEDTDALFAESEGNPLFVVETLRSGWHAGVPHEISPKLHAVTSARLRRLPVPARELLDTACCIGGSFSAAVVGAAAGVDEATLVEGLDILWRSGVIREHGIDAYDFSHNKIRDVAYAGLSPAARRHVHLRVAEALVHTEREGSGAVSGEVAAHFERAGRPLDAIRWYERAAERAQHRFADAEAVRLLDRARSLVPALPPDLAPPTEFEILSRSPIVVGTVKGYESDDLVAVLDRASELAESLECELSAPVLRCLTMTRLCRDDFVGARQSIGQLRDAASRTGDRGLDLEAQYLGGVAALWAGDLASARELLERTAHGLPPDLRTEHLVRFGQDPGTVCLSRLANTMWFLGDTGTARSLRREAETQARRTGHRATAAVVAIFSALLALDLDDDEDVRSRAADLAGSEGHPYNVAVKARALLGYSAATTGQGAQGVAAIRAAVAACHGRNLAPGFRPTVYRVLVAAHDRAGMTVGGLVAADEALALPGTRIWEPQIRRHRARFLARLGRPHDEVDAELDRAAATADRMGATGPLRAIEETRRQLLGG
ncbi:ATP-binding protein [Gordonia rhizosphera]|uniref:Bacterial transcriptional activator domain-containing protein n=1 Tax=Gordonia rhizosphera NBRC 16068 TaxID=1108045 RepID=K6WCW2_9ACTN|nr:BTAD domain-containing putative transcriptional regulator [Gordonia rhizosphera]GAB90032.1 hypothetical protein GORHZ_080_00110 [Gordonia rhizosphera NBRC 16068]